jgi:hypothetical protein
MLTKSQYIIKMLLEAGMDNCNPVATPLDPNIKLSKLLNDIAHPEIQQRYVSIACWRTDVRGNQYTT